MRFSKRILTLGYVLLGVLSWRPEGTCGTAPGFLEGHLKIFASKEVELAGSSSSKFASNYDEHPLIIRSRDGSKEIARGTANRKGDFRLSLPPGDYTLDVEGRGRGLVRTKPQPFTVVSNQTVHIDMDIDTGVR